LPQTRADRGDHQQGLLRDQREDGEEPGALDGYAERQQR